MDHYINEDFFEAVRVHDVRMINELLNRGANIHFSNDRALRQSIRSHMLDISRLLLDRGANVNTQTEPHEISPLMYAIHFENLELLNMLLEYNVDVNAENGIALRSNINYMRTIFHHKRAEIMTKLLEHGADVHCNNGSILIGLEQNFNEVIADLLLPHCEAEDYFYFPNAYIKGRVASIKSARNT